MAWIEIDGKEIPLLEPPETHKEIPRRVVHVLFKYKRLIRNTFFAIGLPLFGIVLLAPQQYVGIVKVLLKPDRAFLSISPGSSESVVKMYPSDDVVNSEIQIIKGREFLGQLAKEFPFPDKGFIDRGSAWGLQAAPVRKSNIIQLSLTSTNPEWAVKVLNTAAEMYQEHSLKVRSTQGIEKFYDEQEQRLKTDLLKAEQDLKQFQEREGIVDAVKEVDSSLSGLAVAEKGLKETDSAIRETEKRIAILEQQLKTQEATISTSKQVTVDPVYGRIRDRLTQLELERDSLLQRYLPKDRLVVDKEREISELRKRLEEVEKTAVGSENISLNTIHQRILNDLLAAKVQLQAFREKRAALVNQVASYSADAAVKKKKSYEYDRLQQVVNAKRESLALYKKRAEEARISDAMDEQKFGGAYILERAALPLYPAGFSTPLWAILISFVSIAGAIGLAFGLHYFDPTVQDEACIEDETGLPVLATIQHYGT